MSQKVYGIGMAFLLSVIITGAAAGMASWLLMA
jgi:hypothetical protein